MKAEYSIAIRPIDVRGQMVDWSIKNTRLKTTVVLKLADGSERQYLGLLCEVGQ